MKFEYLLIIHKNNHKKNNFFDIFLQKIILNQETELLYFTNKLPVNYNGGNLPWNLTGNLPTHNTSQTALDVI